MHASPARAQEPYTELLQRLSRQSVVKHFDAYADVPWDAADHRIDPEDPRWELASDDELGATEWYRDQSREVRTRIGLHRYADFMKTGSHFENVASRGLLEFAQGRPNGSPEFRYAYHEVVEEGQHSLMFQEFVNRSGLDVRGLPATLRVASRWVVALARFFPELFFVFVRGGEDPIDYVQRNELNGARPMHPLLRRIMQIHVTEEARHICFAGAYLRRNVPALAPVRRLRLGICTPILLGVLVRVMLRLSPRLTRTFDVPADVVRGAYASNPRHRAKEFASVRKLYELCGEIGLITTRSARIWKMAGLAPIAAA